MLRYTELSQAALAALEEEDIERLVDIELAHDGIMPVSPPSEVSASHPNSHITKDQKFYEVGGVLFKNESDALTFAKMERFKEDYDYSTGYDFKYPTAITDQPAPVFLYSKEAIDRHAAIIVNHKEAKEAIEDHRKDYEEYKKAMTKVRTNIWNAISEAQSKQRKVDEARNTFEKYIELANGDKAVAIKFFKKTYKDYDELIAAVIGDDHLAASIVADKLTEE